MKKKPYTILAILEAKPGREPELKAVLTELIPPTLKEEGCINFDWHQGITNPQQFMVYENWTSPEAHANHMKTPHLQIAVAKVQPLIAKPNELTAWERFE